MSDPSKADPLNYRAADPLYFDKHYSGIFEPMAECNGERWKREHPALAKILPKAKSMADPNPPRKSRPKPAPLPLRAPERAGDVIVIRLPLPHWVLHKNGRTKNHQWKAKLTKAARNAAHGMAWLVRPSEQWQSVRIDATFWIANRNDDDGAWAYIAAYRDGIADALGLNDKHFLAGSVTQHTGKQANGRREVELTITNLGTA